MANNDLLNNIVEQFAVQQMNPIRNILRNYVYENRQVIVPENYSEVTHNECKTNVERDIKQFINLVKTNVQIKEVLDLIGQHVTNLRNIMLNDITFIDELENNQNNQNNQNDQRVYFPENVYQLLENTYNNLLVSIWQCPYRRSELIQNRANIEELLTQNERNLLESATRLNESLSRLLKIKAQKTLFDYICNGLDNL